MKRNKKLLTQSVFALNESNAIEIGKSIQKSHINEADGSTDIEAFENELIDVFAETIAINQMVADRTLKTIACSVPITNTIASIDSFNIYDPDGRLNLVSNSTYSGEYGSLEREKIDDLVAGTSYNEGDSFKHDGVVYEAVKDGAVVATLDKDGFADAFFEGMIRYCSEAKSGDIRSFMEAGEVDIRNMNFRGHVKSRTAYLSMTPESLMDRLLSVDANLDDIDVDITSVNGDFKTIKVNRILLSIAQYIANERNKDIIHTAISISNKEKALDLSGDKKPDYEIGRMLVKRIRDMASKVSDETKQLVNYAVVSEDVANYLSISGLVHIHSSVTPSSHMTVWDNEGRAEQDHIHSMMWLGDIEIVVDRSSDFDYMMVGVNNQAYNISGIYLSDQEFVLPIKDFGINVDTEGFMNFGSTKLLTATDSDNFSTRIMALSKYALTLYPYNDIANENDLRIQFTDNVTEFANKSKLIKFMGIKLPK